MEPNELEAFLAQTVSPERGAILLRAANLLTQLRYESHEYPILEAMMGFDDADAGSIVDHISEILLVSLKRLLQLSSFVISDDTHEQHIPVLCDIATALATATNELDSINLVSFLDRDDSPVELMAELVSLMTSSTIEEVSEVIESFREETMDAFLDSLREENDKREDAMISFHAVHRERRTKVIARLRQYMQHYNPSFAKRLVIGGFELGLDEPEVYHAVMEDVLVMEKGAEFVQEYIGVLLLTDKTIEEILELVADDIEEMSFTDPNEMTNASTWLMRNKDNILAVMQEG